MRLSFRADESDEAGRAVVDDENGLELPCLLIELHACNPADAQTDLSSETCGSKKYR